MTPRLAYRAFARAQPDALERYAALYERHPEETDAQFIARASEQDAGDPPDSRVFFWEFNA